MTDKMWLHKYIAAMTMSEPYLDNGMTVMNGTPKRPVEDHIILNMGGNTLLYTDVEHPELELVGENVKVGE